MLESAPLSICNDAIVFSHPIIKHHRRWEGLIEAPKVSSGGFTEHPCGRSPHYHRESEEYDRSDRSGNKCSYNQILVKMSYYITGKGVSGIPKTLQSLAYSPFTKMRSCAPS